MRENYTCQNNGSQALTLNEMVHDYLSQPSKKMFHPSSSYVIEQVI